MRKIRLVTYWVDLNHDRRGQSEIRRTSDHEAGVRLLNSMFEPKNPRKPKPSPVTQNAPMSATQYPAPLTGFQYSTGALTGDL